MDGNAVTQVCVLWEPTQLSASRDLLLFKAPMELKNFRISGERVLSEMHSGSELGWGREPALGSDPELLGPGLGRVLASELSEAGLGVVLELESVGGLGSELELGLGLELVLELVSEPGLVSVLEQEPVLE